MRTFQEAIDAAQENEKTFLIEPTHNRSLQYRDIKQETEKIKDRIRQYVPGVQNKIAIALPNGIDAGLCILSVIAGGNVVVPINLGWKNAEFSFIIQDSACSLLISTDEVLREAGVTYACAAEWENGVSFYRVESVRDYFAEKASVPAKQKISLLLYTSGTTGKPKGVMLTEENLLAETFYIREGHALRPEENALQVLPLFHINGLVIGFLTPFFTGETLVIPPKFSAGHFWEWVDTYRISWVSAVPTIISIILSRTPKEFAGGGTLRFLRSASSPLPRAVLREFEERFRVPIVESFGISEGASQITSNPVNGIKKAGSVGLPVGNRIEIVNERTEPVKNGELGEVRVSGENIFIGYYRRPEETSASLKDGWFYTGDLGYLDEDGYLFLQGRKKELINRAGEKFSPKEIDEVLYRYPGIELAAAVGVPHPLYHEEVVAFVRMRDGQPEDEEAILRFCQGRLADFKLPKRIFFRDTFPMGPSGKIQRLKLIPQEPIFT